MFGQGTLYDFNLAANWEAGSDTEIRDTDIRLLCVRDTQKVFE